MPLSNEDLLKLQGHCLEILEEIHRVCTENDISYSLCGGSLIGATLCQGFLPWDDDADVMMDRENYTRFLKVFPEKCAPQYRLAHHSTCDDFHVLFAKVEDLRYSMVEQALGGEVIKNVFVDIAVFDGVANAFTEKCLRLYGAYVSFYLYRRNGQRPNQRISRILSALLAWPRSNASEHRLYARYDAACSKCKHPKYLTELMVPLWRKERYEADLFDKYLFLPFKGKELMGVAKLDSYFLSAFNKTEFAIDAENAATHWSHCLRLVEETEATHRP